MNENLSVIVGSCDLYCPLWKNFDTMFRRYWELQTVNYFSTETKKIDSSNFISVLTNSNVWSDRILEAVQKVKTKYVFFILEDYYLTEKITEEIIQLHIHAMDKFNLDKVMLAPMSSYYKCFKDDFTNYYKFEQESPYLTSVQPSIWNRLFLKRILQQRKYSPWEFEIEGTKYVSQYEHNICITLQKDIYFNVVRKGFKVSQDWEKFKEKHNLEEIKV